MENRTKLIKIIGDMRENKMSYYDIADKLNKMGLKTFSGKSWTYTSVNNFTYNHVNKMKSIVDENQSVVNKYETSFDFIKSIARSNIEPTKAIQLIRGITENVQS